MDVWVAAAIFVVAYALIVIERFDRTLIALLAGLLVVVFGLVDLQQAFDAIDLNVIFLLAGLMVIAGILARTGIFEWIAGKCVRLSRGRPMALLLLLATATALMSTLLPNVTIVVLMVPVTLVVARRLGVTPMPYLITQVFAANIGGTATLIGDPPNIMIGSAADLDFSAFLFNLGPVTVVIYAATVLIAYVAFRRHLEVPTERRVAAVEATEQPTITDRPLLIRSLVVAGATLVGFLVQPTPGLEVGTIALLGAAVLMLVARSGPRDAFREVDWRTLFFFAGLFVLVKALVQVGIVGGIATWLVEQTRGDAALASISLLWLSGGVSAFVDNIPFTATAIPIVQQLVETGLPAPPLWWSLALGACLGGNLTLIGASANIVVANRAAKEGHPIRFLEFLRYGAVITIASLVISTVYLWLRYLS